MMYIIFDLTKFNKTFEEIVTAEDRWLYLLKHAGKAEKLPNFNDSVIAKAIHRILVNRASEKLIKDQANDMVWTEEELDHLALLEVRAEQKGLEKGLEKGLKRDLNRVLNRAMNRDLKKDVLKVRLKALKKAVLKWLSICLPITSLLKKLSSIRICLKARFLSLRLHWRAMLSSNSKHGALIFEP